MTDRPTASTINDAQLDELYARIATLEHVAASNKRHVQAIVPDLERAEAAIARVRELADRWHAREQPHSLYAHDLRTALDGPAPTGTDTTQPEPATVTDPAWLRQQYAAAIHDGPTWMLPQSLTEEVTDAVLAVRDRHVDQLRQRLELADADLRDYTEAESADAAAGSYAGRAEAAEQRLRLAHQARRAKEHQLDGIRRALCDAGFMQDDDPYSHADLEDVIRQNAPDPAPIEATGDPNWLLAGSRDLSIPDHQANEEQSADDEPADEQYRFATEWSEYHAGRRAFLNQQKEV